MGTEDLTAAVTALDRCDEALVKLERLCCEPSRSPSMSAIADTLGSVRENLARLDTGTADVVDVIGELEKAGGQLGSLQVGCCAPARMPLYADMLKDLTDVQLVVNRSAGVGH